MSTPVMLMRYPIPNGSGRRRPPGRLSYGWRAHRPDCRHVTDTAHPSTLEELSGRVAIRYCKTCDPLGMRR